MSDPIQAMLAAGLVPTDDLPATSRYRDVGTATYGSETDAITYFRRRLVPDPDRHPLLLEVQVREGDRRDTLAHSHLLDAFLWWRLADANGVLDPTALETPPGRWLRITGPPGAPGQAAAEGVGREVDDA
jgi:hypothetical protein